jgi:hypothetical protein
MVESPARPKDPCREGLGEGIPWRGGGDGGARDAYIARGLPPYFQVEEAVRHRVTKGRVPARTATALLPERDELGERGRSESVELPLTPSSRRPPGGRSPLFRPAVGSATGAEGRAYAGLPRRAEGAQGRDPGRPPASAPTASPPPRNVRRPTQARGSLLHLRPPRLVALDPRRSGLRAVPSAADGAVGEGVAGDGGGDGGAGQLNACHAYKPDTERDRLQSRWVCLDSLPAPQPMIFAKGEPHDDHHHYSL